MPIVAHGKTVIDRPIGEVFEFLADPRNEPRWLPGATSVEMTGGAPLGRGSTFVGQYARAGRVELELAEFDPPRRVTFRARSRIVHFDDAVELREGDGGTQLTATMTAVPQGPMRLLSPLMGRTMRRQFADNWRYLKEALET